MQLENQHGDRAKNYRNRDFTQTTAAVKIADAYTQFSL